MPSRCVVEFQQSSRGVKRGDLGPEPAQETCAAPSTGCRLDAGEIFLLDSSPMTVFVSAQNEVDIVFFAAMAICVVFLP